MHRSLRRSATLAAICAFLALGTSATAEAQPMASDVAPYCGIYWGSLDKSVGTRIGNQIPIPSVRTGVHPCYDRVVIDIAHRW